MTRGPLTTPAGTKPALIATDSRKVRRGERLFKLVAAATRAVASNPTAAAYSQHSSRSHATSPTTIRNLTPEAGGLVGSVFRINVVSCAELV
jgi:hypothetical protein